MTLGERIKRKRLELGLSQDELAKRSGYASRASINMIELDRRDLPRNKVVALADALHCPPSYIMGWDDEEMANAEVWDSNFANVKFTNEELEEIIKYTDYILSKRKEK